MLPLFELARIFFVFIFYLHLDLFSFQPIGAGVFEFDVGALLALVFSSAVNSGVVRRYSDQGIAFVCLEVY